MRFHFASLFPVGTNPNRRFSFTHQKRRSRRRQSSCTTPFFSSIRPTFTHKQPKNWRTPSSPNSSLSLLRFSHSKRWASNSTFPSRKSSKWRSVCRKPIWRPSSFASLIAPASPYSCPSRFSTQVAPDLSTEHLSARSNEFKTRFGELGSLLHILALFSNAPNLKAVFPHFKLAYTPYTSASAEELQIYNAIVRLFRDLSHSFISCRSDWSFLSLCIVSTESCLRVRSSTDYATKTICTMTMSIPVLYFSLFLLTTRRTL